MRFYSPFVMSGKWCTVIFVIWTIVIGPSPVVGSGRGGVVVNATVTLAEDVGNSGSRRSGSAGANSDGLRNSASARKSDFVIIKSSLGGEESFSRVRRIRRATSTEFLKVKLSSGSYVYRPAPSETNESLTRVTRAYPDSIKKSTSKGGYGYDKPKGYTYTTPEPLVRETTEQNDADSVTLPPPVGVQPDASFRTTTTTEDPADIRDNIPGEPGKDYSALASIPKTTFTCEGRSPGFYADLEAGCQVFHRCTDDPWYTGQVRVIMDSFLCPNGSLFNQQIFSCDWWGNTDCKGSEEFYELNQQIGQLEETDAGTVQYVKFTGIRVPPAPGTKKVAQGIVPKSERKPLAPEYKSKKPSKDGKGGDGKLPLGPDEEEEHQLIEEFVGGEDQDFRPLSSQISEEEDKQGSSQTVDEVKVTTSKRTSKKKSSKKATTTTTTTPAPSSSSEESSSEEETQEPSAANNPNPFVVNRGDRGELGQAATPPGELTPPDFAGEPVGKDETATRSPSPAAATPRADYRDEYLPPKESRGYSYPKPDNSYLPPDKPQNSYLPPRGEYLSGTSPSTNQYLPPTTRAPYTGSQDSYLPPQQGLHTYSPEPDSYYRKPSAGYGQPTPTPPSSEYGTPTNSYLPPKPSNEYLPAPNTPPTEYGQPSKEYGGPAPPSREYGGPAPPPREYGGPVPAPPSREYGGPVPGPPSREYGGPTKDYLPPSNDYLPPNTYSPPPPSNQYIPKSEYTPPPPLSYGTPQVGGYTYFPHHTTVTTEHWPAKFQFEAPVTPSNFFSLHNYAPGGITYGTPAPGTHFDGTERPPETYGLPDRPADTYGTPNRPSDTYGTPNRPTDTYGTPNRPSDAYGTPNRPSDTYGTPNRPSDTYGTPNRPSDTYGTPNRPSDTYGTPNRPSDTYGTPNRPADTYGTPNRPSDTYGTPNRPSDTYGTPNRPSDTYGTPNRPADTYGTPNRPSDAYGTPNSGTPNRDYGVPNTYGPPKLSGDYGPPRNEYLPPAKPQGQYGPPNNEYGLPNSAPKPSGEYGPPRNEYLPPDKPKDQYGPPNNEYGLPNSALKPSGDYGPPRNEYLPPDKPPGQYGPPRNEYGLPNSAPKPSGDYGPPRNEYLPPEKPQGQYGPPRNEYGLPNGPPSNNGYGGPPTTGGYSTLPDHILKEYNPPPTAPSGYSTIPDQTPPPPLYDTSQGTGHPAGLYTIEPPKIDILSVPLVSYSHVVNPILEFPPFKKR